MDARRWMNGIAWAVVATAGTTMATTVPAAAQSADREVMFQVPGGELDYVLTRIAAQAGRRIVFDPAIMRGHSAPDISGKMLPEAAIRRAIAGSDLILRLSQRGDWLIVRAPAATSVAGAKNLATVSVTAAGADGGAVPAGANGSSDPIATEGTKSYTTRGTIVASKEPLALKDTPQAVSVLTRQQIDDRTINSFQDSLGALPGVNVTQGAGGEPVFQSRGFDINNVQIDGGSPLQIGNNQNYRSSFRALDDLSIYDSVAIQRGAAGTFTGVGAPGGAISLERKRPLDHAMLEGTIQVGSWDRVRAVLDGSSPQWLDGAVRARAVLTGERNDYFYDSASRRFAQAYLNVEIIPAAGTNINIGGKISRERDTPFPGLPTDANGQLIDLPRDTCLCTPWSRSITKTRELFAQLRQTIAPGWTARLNGTATWQKGDDDLFFYDPGFGTVGATPGEIGFLATTGVTRGKRRSDQYVLDGFVNGKFALGGVDVELTVGGNYQKINQKVTELNGTFFYQGIPILPFNPRDYRRPDDSELAISQDYFPLYKQAQYGAYSTVRISPTSWLHFTIAERFNAQNVDITQVRPPLLPSRTAVRSRHWSPPNFGLVVDVSRDVSLYGNYNNIYDQYNYVTASGDPVKPLSGINIEGGAKAELRGGTLNLSLSAFYIELQNVPAPDFSTPGSANPLNGANCCYVNDGTQYQSKGLEAQIQGALTNRLNVDLSYTFTDLKLTAGDVTQVVSSAPPQQLQPRHLAKLWASWRPNVLEDRLTLGLGAHAETRVIGRGFFDRLDPNTFNITRDLIELKRPGYVTVDAMARFDLDPTFSLQLNATNLFDRTYYSTVQISTGNYYGQPRAFMLTLRKKT